MQILILMGLFDSIGGVQRNTVNSPNPAPCCDYRECLNSGWQQGKLKKNIAGLKKTYTNKVYVSVKI